eukprot:GSChrysophyteH1.ASY1.ANO1.3021.1 assembled CDS
MCAGCAAGVVGTLIGYPLDSIKTRMQASHGSTNMFSMARHVWIEEGATGFYRGVASPLAALTILNTLNFSSYANFRRLYGVSDENIALGKFEWKVPLAAATVGPLASIISTPFELVKTQMVINNRNGPVGPGTPRPSSILFLSTYFMVYEHTKSRLSQTLSSTFGMNEQGSIPIAGGIAGALGWFVSFPLDCIKSNIQGVPFENGRAAAARPGARQVASRLFRERGVAGLYHGVIPSIMRAFLVSASRFSVYEGALDFLR